MLVRVSHLHSSLASSTSWVAVTVAHHLEKDRPIHSPLM